MAEWWRVGPGLRFHPSNTPSLHVSILLSSVNAKQSSDRSFKPGLAGASPATDAIFKRKSETRNPKQIGIIETRMF